VAPAGRARRLRQVSSAISPGPVAESGSAPGSGVPLRPVSTVRGDAAICPKSGLCHEDAEVSCCVRDEGGPLGAALEEEAPNNHELLRTKAAMVERHGKGAAETASCEDERDERK
jgi:hypothetical protein